MTADESHEMWARPSAPASQHMCGFNYRFVPAVRLAREIVEAGELGDIVHFRARYLQSWGWDADETSWRFDAAQAGTGAIGDLGTHIIDLARYLVGEIESVSRARAHRSSPAARSTTHFVATVEFENGVDRHARGLAPRPRADQLPTPSRSTARRARSPSTWSG